MKKTITNLQNKLSAVRNDCSGELKKAADLYIESLGSLSDEYFDNAKTTELKRDAWEIAFETDNEALYEAFKKSNTVELAKLLTKW